MTSSRLVYGLLTVMLVLAIAPSTFAQVNVSLIPNTSPGEIQTNRMAQTADPGSSATGNNPGAGILVSGQLVANSPLTTTNLILTYPAPLTSSLTVPTADPIRLEGQTGVFAGAVISAINTTANTITIQLPGTLIVPNTQSGSFRLVGPRLDLNGKTAPVVVAAALSSSANNYILQTPTATVINTIGAGIASIALGARTGATDNGSATIFTNRNIVDATGNFIITEGFATALRTALQLSNSAVAVPNSTQIRLTFSNVPAGTTMTLTGTAGATTTFTFSNSTINSTTNTTVLSFATASMTATDVIQVNYTVTAQSAASAAPPAGTISVTATMFPLGDADSGATVVVPNETTGYPRFAQADVGPITIVNIVPANTTLLMPYAAVLAPFDTGLAIANTTADPFGSSGGGATATAGAITLTFFPTAATGGASTSWSLATSSTLKPGAGLSSDGTLAPGATWTVLLSQVMSAAGQTGNFIGYVFIQANFLNAHGTATISDFRTYSLSAHVLVLPPPSTAARTAPTAANGEVNGAESLSF